MIEANNIISAPAVPDFEELYLARNAQFGCSRKEFAAFLSKPSVERDCFISQQSVGHKIKAEVVQVIISAKK